MTLYQMTLFNIQEESFVSSMFSQTIYNFSLCVAIHRAVPMFQTIGLSGKSSTAPLPLTLYNLAKP